MRKLKFFILDVLIRLRLGCFLFYKTIKSTNQKLQSLNTCEMVFFFHILCFFYTQVAFVFHAQEDFKSFSTIFSLFILLPFKRFLLKSLFVYFWGFFSGKIWPMNLHAFLYIRKIPHKII